MALFLNRTDAGEQLAQALGQFAGDHRVIVLGLPRGGVPVAAAVARKLGAPLDVFVVRKLGVPGQEELAMGAIASGGVRVLNEDVIGYLRVPPEVINEVTKAESEELARRELLYRGGRRPLDLKGKIAIVLDDGLATGSTMRAAVAAVRTLDPAKVIVAVPVGARQSCTELSRQADYAICLHTPEPFTSVGTWYEDFSQTTDREVRLLLGNGEI